MPTVAGRASRGTRFRIGRWFLDALSSRIERDGECVRLEPRLADLLTYFARHPGRVLAKEELIQEVWGGRALDSAAVARAVAELRKALGDTAMTPRYIETIPKRGYRLVANVDRPRRPLTGRLGLVAATAALVLITALTTHRLVAPGATLATEQDATVAADPSSEEALGAYSLAAEALRRGGQRGNETAIVHLERALHLDPDLGIARAGLAEAYSIRATSYGADGDWADAALVEASRAVVLAPELADAHQALAFALSVNGRFGEAESSYRRALGMRPQDEDLAVRLVEILTYRGNWPEALAILTSISIDRVDPHCELANLLFGLDYAADALAWFDATLDKEPFELCAGLHLALWDLRLGELEMARARAERLSAASPGCCDQLLGEIAYRQDRSTEAVSYFERALETAVEPKSTLMNIRLAQLAGEDEPLRILAVSLERELNSGVDIWFPAWLLTLIYAEVGNVAEALRWHDEATARGYLEWRTDLTEPTFQSLRETVDFQAAIGDMRARIAEMRAEIEDRGLIDELRAQIHRSVRKGR